MVSTKKALFTAAVACAGLLVAPTAAQAAPISGVASGSLGAVDVVVNGQAAVIDPLAPCETTGTQENSSSGTSAGATTYGRGTTTCKPNANDRATAVASGQRFETRVLREFGGPIIRIRSYTAQCETTKNGSSGHVELAGVNGIRIPQNIPGNYKVTIPSQNSSAPPLAEVIVNELVTPTPPDGSLTTHTMHIKLFPQGGPASGDIFVGTASCDPYGE